MREGLQVTLGIDPDSTGVMIFTAGGWKYFAHAEGIGLRLGDGLVYFGGDVVATTGCELPTWNDAP